MMKNIEECVAHKIITMPNEQSKYYIEFEKAQNEIAILESFRKKNFNEEENRIIKIYGQ
jgi:hypothetical protein